MTTAPSTPAALTPVAPETRVRFHAASVSVEDSAPRLIDGMFGYAVLKNAADDVAYYTRAEAAMAQEEGRPIQEVFFVAKSTMTFEVVEPVEQAQDGVEA